MRSPGTDKGSVLTFYTNGVNSEDRPLYVLGDSISTLSATNVGSATGVPSTSGLVTQFSAWTPTLGARRANDTLRLYWWEEVDVFSLQTTANVGPAAA